MGLSIFTQNDDTSFFNFPIELPELHEFGMCKVSFQTGNRGLSTGDGEPYRTHYSYRNI